MNPEHADTVKTLRMGAGISITEGVAGLGAVALAIIGLADIVPWVLASIAAIALGAGFLFEAGAIAARFSALERGRQTLAGFRTWVRWGSIFVEFLAGCGGITLGILALLDINPMVLIPVAVIIYGGAFVMDSGIRMSLKNLEGEYSGRWMGIASSGIEVLVGLGGITLSILAIVGIAPQTLSLVALLSIGAAVLVVGSLTGGRIISMSRSLLA